MGRTRLIPDSEVYATIRRLLLDGGEKAVTFSSVARLTGLAAPTLVQRYGARDAMLRDALMASWDTLNALTEEAAAGTALSEKGAAQFLKRLAGTDAEGADLALLAADFRDAALRTRAETWRSMVEAALALRLGGGAKGREAAALLFAVWQGQILWKGIGGRGFRIKDAIRKLA